MDASWSYLLHMRSIGVENTPRSENPGAPPADHRTFSFMPTDHKIPLLTSVPHTLVTSEIFLHLREEILRQCGVTSFGVVHQTPSLCGMIEPTLDSHNDHHVICVRQADDVSLDAFMARLPTIAVAVDGFQSDMSTGLSHILIKPEHYMTNPDSGDTRKWCSSIFRHVHSHDIYLGSDVLRGYEWVFDLDRREIAWTPATCDEVYTVSKAPPSLIPPAHIATVFPTTNTEEGECCVTTTCSDVQSPASLAVNQLSFPKMSSGLTTVHLAFKPTREHSELNCLLLGAGIALDVEAVRTEDVAQVSICPTHHSRCVFSHWSKAIIFNSLANAQGRSVLVGSLFGVQGVHVLRLVHVIVNGAIMMRRGLEIVPSLVSGMLETSNKGAATDHYVKLSLTDRGLHVNGWLVLNTDTVVLCFSSDGGIRVRSFESGHDAGVKVGNAKHVNIKCTVDLGEGSVLELGPSMYHNGTVNDARNVRVNRVIGDEGSILFVLGLDLLSERIRSDVRPPELTVPNLFSEFGASPSRTFDGTLKLSLRVRKTCPIGANTGLWSIRSCTVSQGRRISSMKST
jgi:hypothetical protein